MDKPAGRPGWTETSTRREGRYLLGPLLGNGGMGDVFEAWDTVLNRVVALKILTQAEPAAMIRFVHEAQLQARLEHPGICRIYDIEVRDGIPRIAMQRVPGPTLEEASPDLTLEACITLTAEVAETLAHAHRHGLIHRDVKPGNILLEPLDDGGLRPVLCDFGLALALQESGLTQPNALTGTPAYMAPEQVRGDRSLVGPATDVYALGGTLYFLLAGRPPCISTVTREMLRVKKERRFPAPRALEPSVPAELEAILLRCLAPDTLDRYPSMEDLARDLWACLGIRRPAIAPRPRPRAWPRLAGAAALGLLALLLTVPGAWTHRAEASNRQYLEARNLEEGLGAERARDVHDVRDALRRLRQARDAASAPDLCRGTADLCLGRYPEARAELARAWSAGGDRPETAFALGMACAEAWQEAAMEAAWRGLSPAADLNREAVAWFQRAHGLSLDREELAQGTFAFLVQDLPSALAHARASQNANPWRAEAALLGVRVLVRQAWRAERSGDPAHAADTLRQATAWAAESLRGAPSDTRLHHALLTARLALARLDRTAGRLTLPDLASLETLAARALQVDPEAPAAQGDWLALQSLKARLLEDLGRNPAPVLHQALEYYWSRTREPRPVDLRAAHMTLYGLIAQREAIQGRSPEAALTEALRGAGHCPGEQPDALEEILNLKNRLEAARSPRPEGLARTAVHRLTDAPAATPEG